MANVANYVKFLRGTPTAYNNLATKDSDTLYFIAEKDATVGKLYLGSVCIAGSLNEEGLVDYLSELKDVDTSGAKQNSLLGFDETKQKWIPMDLDTFVSISVMGGASETADGTSGLVPAPHVGDENKFLRGDGSWASVQSLIGDNKTIEVDAAGAIHLFGALNASQDTLPVIDNEGKLIWKPIAEIAPEDENDNTTYTFEPIVTAEGEVIGIQINPYFNGQPVEGGVIEIEFDVYTKNEIDNLIEVKADKDNVYTKEEMDAVVDALGAEIDSKAAAADVYTKGETDLAISTAVVNADHLKRKIVEKYVDIQTYIDQHDDADQYIYMVPTVYHYTQESNKYDEYIYINNIIEPVGSWAIDLEDYYTKTEADNKFVVVEAGKSLVLDSEIEKLSTVQANAEENFIKDVNNTQFTVSENGALNLTPAITNALLSESDKQKLDALVLGDNNNIEISGKVNAANVEGLATWITDNRNAVAGLFSATAATKLESVETGAQKNFITAVEESQFTVANGKLELTSGITKALSDLSDASTLHTTKIDSLDKILNGYTDESGEQVQGLVAIVNDFVNTHVTISDFKSVVGDLDQMKSKGVNLWNDVQAIQEVLKWQTMTE